jgi:ABC-type transport system substrate-binding protein
MAVHHRSEIARRRLLRSLAVAAGAGSAASLLAACAPAAPPTPTTAPKSAEAPKPAAPAEPTKPAAAAAGPTTAPAAAAATKPAAAPTTAPAAAAPTTVSSPQAGAQAAKPAAGATLNLHWRTDAPVSFNVLFSTSGSEQQVERLIFGGLLKMSDKLDTVPDLAEKWEISPDATTYTFTLRPNLKWSDGTALTADDVLFTFERAIDKRTGSIWAGRLGGIEGSAEFGDQKAEKIAGLTAPSPTTVRLKLSKPDAAFLTTLGSFSGLALLPKHVLKDVAPDQLKAHRFSTQAPSVGAGAYVFANYQSGQFVELRANDNYFKGKPKVDRIFLKLLANDVALAQLQTGEVDFAKPAIGEIDRVKRDPNLTLLSVPSPSISQMAINNDRPFLKDKRVRQAMMHAIDRQGIVDSILGGQATLVNSPVIGPDWIGQPEFNKYPFDPARAKVLLGEARWDPGQKVEMMVPTGDKTVDAYGAVIHKQLRDVGIALDIRQVDSAEVNKRYIQTSDYDLFLFGGGVYRAEPSIAATYYHSRNLTPRGGNGTHYVNPKLDQLLDDGVATADREKRKSIYLEIAKILNDEVPTLFLWSPNSIYAIRKRLQGFKPPAYIDNYVWNAEEWSVG